MTDSTDFYANPDNYNTIHAGTIMKEEFKNKEKVTDNIKTFSELVKNIEKLIDDGLGFETNTSGTKTLYLIMRSKEYLIENFEYETKCRIEFFNFPESPTLYSKNFDNMFYLIKGLWEAENV